MENAIANGATFCRGRSCASRHLLLWRHRERSLHIACLVPKRAQSRDRVDSTFCRKILRRPDLPPELARSQEHRDLPDTAAGCRVDPKRKARDATRATLAQRKYG